MKYRLVCTLAVVLLLTPLVAQGGVLLFDGQTVEAWHHFETIDAIYSGPLTAVVGAGVEFPASLNGAFNLDISNTNLYITYNWSGTWTGAAFNGFQIFDVNGTIPSFSSVVINGATNMGGFDASRIIFDANNIWVNWQDLSFAPGTIVSLDVNGGSEVPEPSTMLLVGMGAVGILASRRRRRN